MNQAHEQSYESAPLSLPSRPAAWSQWLVAFVPPLAITVSAVTVFSDAIYRSIASSAHPVLVYVILAAYFLGLLMCAVALWRYQRESRYVWLWQKRVVKGRMPDLGSSERADGQPIVAAALSSLLARLAPPQRQARFELEVAAASSALADRLAYANYIVGALIGLGLVGTFVGLLGTLEDLGAVFGSLAGTGNADMNPTAVFSNMVQKLQDPMKGMGTAFVCSLYGLLGSLVVGLCALSVSKAGSAVVKQLYAAARTLETVIGQAAGQESDSPELAASTLQLQSLMTRILENQADRETHLQEWLQASEGRLTHFFSQTLQASQMAHHEMLASHRKVAEQLAALFKAHGETMEANRMANSEVLANHKQVGEKLAALLSAHGQTLEANRIASDEALANHRQVGEQLTSLLNAHGQSTQALSSRLVEQEQHLSETVRELVERVNEGQGFLRQDVLGSLERIQTDRTTEVAEISRAVSQLSGLTERSASLLQHHIENQEAQTALLVQKSKPKRSWWWPFGNSDQWGDEELIEQRQDAALALLAKSIDRQSQVLEGFVHRRRPAPSQRASHD